MPAPSKSKRPKARDDDGMAVERGNAAAERRAKEAKMDKKDKKPAKKKRGGKMAKKMASGGVARGMGAATKGGKFTRSG